MDELTEKGTELASDFLEFGVDQFISNDLLKEFPVIGAPVKLALLGKQISDKIFLKKLYLFLTAFEKQSGKEKNKLLQKLRRSDKRQEIGENLLLLVDKFDNFNKASILATVFIAYLEEKVDVESYNRLAAAINQAFIDDLKELIAKGEAVEADVMERLQFTGFAARSRTSFNFSSEFSVSSIHLTKLGTDFHQLFK